MPSPPDRRPARPSRTALITALTATVLLAGVPSAHADPVVYQAGVQDAGCSDSADTASGCPPAAGTGRVSDDSRQHARSSRSPSQDARPETTGTNGGRAHNDATGDRAGRTSAEGASPSHLHADRATAPSAPAGADTTSGNPASGHQPSPATTGDPFTNLGGQSPSCRGGATGQSAINCRATGSPAHRYPIGNYTYDIKIDTGLTHFSDNLLAALQTLASFLWLGLLYAIKGILLALDWAFHLNLINTNIDKVHGGLLTMDRIFGLDSDYFSLALTLAALWGMWHGFVRGKYIQTVAGLGACVGLMLIALLIVHDPAGTVGKVGNWGDSAGREVASSVAGAVQPGDQAQADEDGLDRGAQAIFDTVVLRPWCALEFGDVNFCLSRPPTNLRYYDGAGEFHDNAVAASTVADLWLRFPANGTERNKLYEAWKDDGDAATQSRVEMMQGQSTGKRLALLVIIVAGLLGALLLLGWIGFWLIAFAAVALFLLLLAPFMFLLPALGESGRRGFVTWGQRLLGALIAKVLYAIVLGIVIYVAALIAEMGQPGGLGWLGVWLLEAIFWWVAFVKRHDLVNLLTFAAAQGGAEGARARRGGLAGLYYKSRLSQEAMRTVQRPVTRHVRRQAARERMAESAAAGSTARERLAHHADRSLDLEYEQSQRKLRERRAWQNELKGVEAALKPADESRALRSVGESRPSSLPTDSENELRVRRATLQDLIYAPEIRQAEETVRRAAANEASHGRRWTPDDHDRWIARRRRELAQRAPATGDPERERWTDRRLMAAGIDPDEYLVARPEQQTMLLDRAARAGDIQRDLLRGVPADGDLAQLGYADLRAVRKTVHDQEWRRARTQARRAMHRDAWRRRGRENLFRAGR
jgi:hypothetical protein